MPARNVSGICTAARTSLHSFRSGPGFSNAVDVCTQISHVALFDASSPNTLRRRVQPVLVNQRHNFSYSKACAFPERREAQQSEYSKADLITLLCSGTMPHSLSPSLFPAYHPAMTQATVNGTLFLFLFRCEKCHKPITAWSRAPKPGTLEEAEKHVLPLHCVKECGWSSAKMGSEAIASWAVPWHHHTEK